METDDNAKDLKDKGEKANAPEEARVWHLLVHDDVDSQFPPVLLFQI